MPRGPQGALSRQAAGHDTGSLRKPDRARRAANLGFWQWFTETARSRAPAWRNEVTLRSVEMFLEYEPGAHITHISPTPMMMVVALGDHLTVADEALAAYERALEPKRVMLPAGILTRTCRISRPLLEPPASGSRASARHQVTLKGELIRPAGGPLSSGGENHIDTTPSPTDGRHEVMDRDLNAYRCAEPHGGCCQMSKIRA